MLISLLSFGLTVSDTELFDIGMLIDIITTGNNINSESNKQEARTATQKDFDKFSGR